MSSFDSLLDCVNALEIIDTHEHLPFEDERQEGSDVLSEWLTHYASSDLISAGMPDEALAEARDASKDLEKRWKLAEPYWQAAKSTGYWRALALASRDLYGVEELSSRTIATLDERFKAARANGGHYDFVLREKSKIALAIRDSMPLPYKEPSDIFAFAFLADDLILPSNRAQMRSLGAFEGVEINSLDDWMALARRQIARYLDGSTRTVCLKSRLAYSRSLSFGKTSRADAERAFKELFEDGKQAKAGEALSGWMMHFICGLADDLRLPFQIHTGIQEGNGNRVGGSNPMLLSNLLLEYGNARFDLMHMGYPYVMELGALAKLFRNVHIDMCWGHIISPEAARRALAEWLDAVPANKISAFGGDYCFIDGVYGHQLIARRNVAMALAQKVDDGSFDLARAEEIAQWLFVDNPKRLFGLERLLPATRREGKCP